MLLSFLCAILAIGQNAGDGFERIGKSLPVQTEKQLLHVKKRGTSESHKLAGVKQNFPSPISLAARKAAAGNRPTNIVGSLVYNNFDYFWDFGMYRFTAPEYTDTALAITDDFQATGGGVRVGQYYYCINVQEMFGYYFVYFRKIDTETWKEVDAKQTQFKDSGSDITYDATTDKVYGCFVNDFSNGYVWGTLNLETGKRQSIADLQMPLAAVAADANGQIFAIGTDGILYKVEKEIGKLTSIGSTGLKVGTQLCSGTIDQKRGDFYWAVCPEGGKSGLYTVDLSTGKAEFLYEFPNEEVYLGIYVEEPLAEDGAPAVATALTADFQDGSTTGHISFEVPTLTFAGETLTGDVTYTIKANDVEVATEQTTPGAKVAKELTLPAGMTTVEVYLSNAAGKGPSVRTSLFIGKDAPKQVQDLAVEATDVPDQIKISWKAPVETVNGGYLDVNGLRYKLVRKSDNKVLAEDMAATSFVDEITTAYQQSVWYEVTSFVGDMSGESAESNALVVGDYCQLPYYEPFDTPHSMDLFTIINVHNDKYTWKYDDSRQLATCPYDFNNPKNDWLILPPFKLESDFVYRLSFNTSTKRVLPESFEIRMGKSNTVADMTTVIMADTTITTDEYVTDIESLFENNIQVAETGIYYIGIHATSEPQMADLRLDNIKLEAVSAQSAPEAVSDLKAVSAENGKLEAILTFVTPSKSISGADLTTLTKVEVSSESKVVGTIDNPETGKELSITVPAKQGTNEFRIIAYNEAGSGVESKISVYVGVDKPASPQHVILKTEGNEFVLTWEAPTTGESGGYIDPNTLTYAILRGSDYTIVEENYQGTTYKQAIPQSELQIIETYVVYAKSAAGTGSGVPSNQAIGGGKTYHIPFVESFPNAAFTTTPWGLSGTTSLWWLSSKAGSNDSPQDNDKGLVYYQPEASNDAAQFFTPRVSLAGSEKPAITFYYYQHEQLKNVKLTIQVTENYAEFEQIEEIDFNTREAEAGWNKVVVGLDKFKGSTGVSVAFLAQNGESDYGALYIDNVRIVDNLDYNLTLIDFEAPTGMEIGSEYPFLVSVENRGTQECSDYTVVLLQNGEVINKAVGKTLKPEEYLGYQFKVKATADLKENLTYEAIIEFDKDENTPDNKSEAVNVVVETPEYPYINDLKGTESNEGVELSWTAPELKYIQAPFIDTFEDYEPFIIENIGEWKLYDGDEDPTFVIAYQGAPVQYKNSGEPMAYQVFNAGLAGIGEEVTGYRAFEAYEGKQSLNAFCSEIGQSDDWLISPELNGKKQFVSFYVKSSILNFGYENFEVYVSKTGNKPKDFVKVDGIDGNAPGDWKQIVVSLEEGTKYFAIRYISSGRLTMLLDNIKYTPANAKEERLEIVGYNIYRDGEKINAEPVSGTTYIDTFGDGQKHQYNVTVVYKQGESVQSNTCMVETSNGINALSANGARVTAQEGKIVIEQAVGCRVIVSSIDGKVVYDEASDKESRVIAVQTGIYMIRVENGVWKVNVR